MQQTAIRKIPLFLGQIPLFATLLIFQLAGNNNINYLQNLIYYEKDPLKPRRISRGDRQTFGPGEHATVYR
jgi:hypothetical protein